MEMAAKKVQVLQLIRACRDGELEVVKRFVQEGVPLCHYVLLITARGDHLEVWHWLKTTQYIPETDSTGLYPIELVKSFPESSSCSLLVAAYFGTTTEFICAIT
jgi:hypothetical protein